MKPDNSILHRLEEEVLDLHKTHYSYIDGKKVLTSYTFKRESELLRRVLSTRLTLKILVSTLSEYNTELPLIYSKKYPCDSLEILSWYEQIYSIFLNLSKDNVETISYRTLFLECESLLKSIQSRTEWNIAEVWSNNPYKDEINIEKERGVSGKISEAELALLKAEVYKLLDTHFTFIDRKKVVTTGTLRTHSKILATLKQRRIHINTLLEVVGNEVPLVKSRKGPFDPNELEKEKQQRVKQLNYEIDQLRVSIVIPEKVTPQFIFKQYRSLYNKISQLQKADPEFSWWELMKSWGRDYYEKFDRTIGCEQDCIDKLDWILHIESIEQWDFAFLEAKYPQFYKKLSKYFPNKKDFLEILSSSLKDSFYENFWDTYSQTIGFYESEINRLISEINELRVEIVLSEEITPRFLFENHRQLYDKILELQKIDSQFSWWELMKSWGDEYYKIFDKALESQQDCIDKLKWILHINSIKQWNFILIKDKYLQFHNKCLNFFSDTDVFFEALPKDLKDTFDNDVWGIHSRKIESYENEITQLMNNKNLSQWSFYQMEKYSPSLYSKILLYCSVHFQKDRNLLLEEFSKSMRTKYNSNMDDPQYRKANSIYITPYFPEDIDKKRLSLVKQLEDSYQYDEIIPSYDRNSDKYLGVYFTSVGGFLVCLKYFTNDGLSKLRSESPIVQYAIFAEKIRRNIPKDREWRIQDISNKALQSEFTSICENGRESLVLQHLPTTQRARFLRKGQRATAASRIQNIERNNVIDMDSVNSILEVEGYNRTGKITFSLLQRLRDQLELGNQYAVLISNTILESYISTILDSFAGVIKGNISEILLRLDLTEENWKQKLLQRAAVLSSDYNTVSKDSIIPGSDNLTLESTFVGQQDIEFWDDE